MCVCVRGLLQEESEKLSQREAWVAEREHKVVSIECLLHEAYATLQQYTEEELSLKWKQFKEVGTHFPFTYILYVLYICMYMCRYVYMCSEQSCPHVVRVRASCSERVLLFLIHRRTCSSTIHLGYAGNQECLREVGAGPEGERQGEQEAEGLL